MSSRTPLLLSLSACLLAPVSAQSFETAFETGGVTPDVGTVIGIRDFVPPYRAIVETDHPDPANRWALFHGYSYYVQAGHGHSYIGRASDIASLEGSGWHGIVDFQGVKRLFSPICGFDFTMQTGDPVHSLPWLGNANWVDFADNQTISTFNSFLRGTTLDRFGVTRNVLARGLFNHNGLTANGKLLAAEGKLVAGTGLPLTELFMHAEGAHIASTPEWIFSGAIEPNPGQPETFIAYKNSYFVVQEGTPSPVAGHLFGHDPAPSVAIHDDGYWAARTLLDNGDAVILRSGELIAVEGQATSAGVLRSIGTERPIFTTQGDLLWFGTIDPPGSPLRETLFLGAAPLIQAGITTFQQDVITGFGSGPRVLTSDYDRVYVRVELSSGEEKVISFETLLGSMAWMSAANSTTKKARIVMRGFEKGRDAVSLHAYNMPPGEPLLLVATSDLGNTPYANSLLIGGSLQRVWSGSTGTGTRWLEVDLEPLVASGLISAGSPTTFQGWFRDSADPVHAGNVTSAWRVTFQ